MNGKASTSGIITFCLIVGATTGDFIFLSYLLTRSWWLGQQVRWETYYYSGDYSFATWQSYCGDSYASWVSWWSERWARCLQIDFAANLAQCGAVMATWDWWALILIVIFVGVGAIMAKAGAKEEAWIIYVFMLAATLVGLMPIYANPIDFIIFW